MHPIIAEFGPFTLYSYGMMVAIAFIVGIYFARQEALRKDIKPDLVYDLVFFLTIGSLIGARLYYLAFFDPTSFVKNPVSIFKIWGGGLAVHGAILGGIIACVLFARSRRMSFWKLTDLITPSVILGQAIGRIGCFLNGCCFGVPTDSVFGVRFPKGSLPDIAYAGLPVHPAQLYEFALDLAGFFILWAMRRKIRFEGGLFLAYLAMYSIIRMIISSLRGDSLYIWNTNLKIAQVISGIIFVIALNLFISKRKKSA
ncbi:MAG: prolipoprotein diacylglyceryl transferase [Candidatus Omnitrophica bacterium]|nr:prolipoprotein diacylglyceryl transferase [Candidatus Omnitrophota bacterium]